MFCTNCGKPVKDGASFCGACGQPIKKVTMPGEEKTVIPFLEEGKTPVDFSTEYETPAPKGRASSHGKKTDKHMALNIALLVLAVVLLAAAVTGLLVCLDVLELPFLNSDASEQEAYIEPSDDQEEALENSSRVEDYDPSDMAENQEPDDTSPTEGQKESAEADTEASGPVSTKIIIGTSASYEPFAFYSGGEVVGFDMDLIQLLAADLGLEYELLEMDFDMLMVSLQAGEVDLAIAAITPMEERRAYADFTATYASEYRDGTSYSYAIAAPKGSELLADVDRQLGIYCSDGTIEALERKWRTGSEYLLPTSSSEYLTVDDLKNLSWEECCLARNEIFARHGRIFQTPEIAAYFESKSWYHGTISGADFDSGVFNEYEKSNVTLIQQYEKDTWGGSYYQ